MKCFNISDVEQNVEGTPFAKLARVDDVFVTGKIDNHDQINFLQEKGIKLAIDLKVPGENQFSEEENFKMAGIHYINFPVSNIDDLNFEQAQAFGNLLENQEGPKLVYCMSGNRVGALLALHLAFVCGHSKKTSFEVGEKVGMIKDATKECILKKLELNS